MLSFRSLYVFRARSLVNRAFVVGGVILFIAIYNYLYIHWLAPTFGYAGMTYRAPAQSMLLAAWLLAVLPSLWMPVTLARVSQLPYWFIYLMVYVPSMFNPLYMGLQSNYDLAILMLCMFAGLVVLSCTYLAAPIRLTHHLIPSSLFWPVVIAITVILDLWVIAIYHSNMHLVGFNAVYTLRSQASEMAKGTGVGYAMMILESLLDPLYIAYGLFRKRKAMVALGFLNQLMLYSIDGSKAVILSVVLLLGLFVIIGRSSRTFGRRLVGAMVAVLLVLLLISLFGKANPVLSVALSLLFSRTFATGGFNTGVYSAFFASHPLTYLSTVHGISWFVHYPYSNPLGFVVGYGALGSPDLDANAHFWATDGIAAFGPIGIVLISIICAAVFWILDSASSRHDILFCSLAVAFDTLVLTNVSLFTALISGGLGLLIVLLMGMPSTKLAEDNRLEAYVDEP